MHLEPRNAECHHNIGHSVGLGEQVGDLLARADVPVGHAGGYHLVLRTLGQASALSHAFHDLKGALWGHPLGNEEQHNIVTAADGLADLGRARGDQVLGVAQPHIRTVGKAGQPHQNIKLVGLGILQHTAHEAGAEFRNGRTAGGAEYRIVLIAQRLGGLEDGHGVPVIQRDLLGVDPGDVLQHADHGRVIVPKHIQFE